MDLNKNDVEKYLKELNDLSQNLDDKTAEFQQNLNKVNNHIQITKDNLDSLLRQQKFFINNDPQVYQNNTLNTTQFFNGSLAKDVFNMDGNAVPWYYKTYARKVRGLNMQGRNAYAVTDNELNNQSPNGTITQTNNGSSGVGFTQSPLYATMQQKWWAWWVVQLCTIQKLTGLVTFESENKRLLVTLYKLYQLAILCGFSVIEKLDEKHFKIYCAYNVKYNSLQEPETCTISDPDWFFNAGQIPDDKQDKEINLNEDKYILLNWDVNNYNLWFYTVFYTVDYIDLLYIWLNRCFISRAIVFQEVGSPQASKQEAEQLLNPINSIIQIRTSALEEAEKLIESPRSNEMTIANKYKYLQLGDAQSDAVFSSFPKIWLNIWDSVLGIVPPNNKLDASRSISDEVMPNETINQILQKKYGLPLDLFCEDLKEKWGIELTYKLAFEEQQENQEKLAKENNQNGDPAYKNEGGGKVDNGEQL